MARLSLKPGPLLIARHLGRNASDEVDWLETPATAEAHEWLDVPVDLDAGVTLGDLLGLLGHSPLLQQVYARLHAADVSAEAAKGPCDAPESDPADALEYLELCQYWSLDTATRTYEPIHRLTLHGMGLVQTRDRPDAGCVAGERILWVVKGSALRSLLALPLRVSPQVVVSEAGSKDYGRDIDEALHPHVTLGQVLYSVLWELTYFGAPSEREETVEELARQLAAASREPGVSMSGEEFSAWLDRFQRDNP